VRIELFNMREEACLIRESTADEIFITRYNRRIENDKVGFVKANNVNT